MVRKIVHVNDEGGIDILTKPAEVTSFEEGLKIVKDLIDTANDNNEYNPKMCCGLAANQIGESKRAFIIQLPDKKWLPVINPKIAGLSREKHISNEGCMSSNKITNVERHNSVTIIFQSQSKKYIKQTFTGFTADEVQHEMDHLKGVLI